MDLRDTLALMVAIPFIVSGLFLCFLMLTAREDDGYDPYDPEGR